MTSELALPLTLKLGRYIRTPTVAHVVPFDGIGGVEIAVRSLRCGQHCSMTLHKCFIAFRDTVQDCSCCHQGPNPSENNLLNYILTVACLLKLKPDLLVGSLWRGCLVLLAFKLIRPSAKIVVFLHSSRSAHFLDRLVNTLAMRLAVQIWADSATTLKTRVPPALRPHGRVISFLTERNFGSERTLAAETALSCSFVFWGRLHSDKGLESALTLFSMIIRRFPDSTYTIIGPDGGEYDQLEVLCQSLGIRHAVHFLGPMAQIEIPERVAGHSFYLQTSSLEGMAMSVVEAMQLGLVPVVTPVGEIANYCRHMENGIIHRDIPSTVAAIEAVVADPERYTAMSRAAIETWRGAPLYADDFAAAAAELFAATGAGAGMNGRP